MHRIIKDDYTVAVRVAVIARANFDAAHVEGDVRASGVLSAKGPHGSHMRRLDTKIQTREFMTVADSAVEDQTGPARSMSVGGDVAAAESATCGASTVDDQNFAFAALANSCRVS